MLKVLYYNYWLWSKAVGQPKMGIALGSHFALWGFITLPLCATLDAMSKRYEFELDRDILIVIAVVVWVALYFALVHNGKGKKIYEEKPKLFNSYTASKVFTAAFTLASLIITFLEAP